MDIQLVAADLDGTTLKDDKTVSEATISAFRSATQHGVKIIPATGRTLNMIPKQIIGLDCVQYAVTSNGASVVRLADNYVIYSNLINKNAALKILNILSEYNIAIEVFLNGNAYSEKGLLSRLPHYDISELRYFYRTEFQIYVDNLQKLVKNQKSLPEKICMPYIPDQSLRKEIIEKLSKVEGCSVTSANDKDVEINSETANKGDGIKHLCDYLNIEKSKVMVFGDQKNDIEMFKFAGFSAAMGNADEALKHVASIVTETNENDGVALAIRKYVLGC